MDHGNLPILRGNRPCAVLIFRQLLAVEVHAAPDAAGLIYADVQRSGVENAPGGVGSGIGAPLPTGIVNAGGILMVQNGFVDGGHGGQVKFIGETDHKKFPPVLIGMKRRAGVRSARPSVC